MHKPASTMLSGKKLGFSLAEVLLVITIIGVVASLTVPNLIINIREQSWQTSWEKQYNVMEQAARQSVEENGGSLYNNFYNDWNYAPFTRTRNGIGKYLKVAKYCEIHAVMGKCWAPFTYDLNGVLTASDGMGNSYPGTGLVLTDGTFVGFGPQAGTTYINIQVDVNGNNSPNTYGKDIYRMILTRNRLYPYGSEADPTGHALSLGGRMRDCIPGGTQWFVTGFGCSAKYLLE